jgi:nucleotide-binding universal stress UspA family protein
MYKRVIVGTDLSSTSKLAVERSAALAERMGSDLVLVYAGSDPGDELQELASKYKGEAKVIASTPVDALIDEASEGDLLVVGSVGMSGARRFMLGQVPNKVSHHATTDLLVVKTDSKGADVAPYKAILVGSDGSPTATLAVETAARLAAAIGIGMTIVCAYEPPSGEELDRLKSGDVLDQWGAHDRSFKDVPDELRWRIASATQAGDVLERSQEHAAKHGVEATTTAVEGPAADVLLKIAEEGDYGLVAVGSVGMSGTKRFMLGNVPNRISHHAKKDVLIIRTG